MNLKIINRRNRKDWKRFIDDAMEIAYSTRGNVSKAAVKLQKTPFFRKYGEQLGDDEGYDFLLRVANGMNTFVDIEDTVALFYAFDRYSDDADEIIYYIYGTG